MSSNRSRKSQRIRLFKLQDGKCFYCQKQLSLNQNDFQPYLPPNYATLEHPFDKNGGQRINYKVVACYTCNHERSILKISALEFRKMKQKKDKIIITIENGAIQNVEGLPPYTQLIIYDYDRDLDESSPTVEKDENGDLREVITWRN